ncbi:hypothetical protein PVK06_041775 [Gossypium arboreum]|uniref:DC1 domain-containing protein n=1 Tax=Gossypium arboreum TaxID=29729 RepID=A0ABR0NA17_GOSAR|nr:hypothetical protein PVK06_041775 [Gossypium arboreum]
MASPTASNAFSTSMFSAVHSRTLLNTKHMSIPFFGKVNKRSDYTGYGFSYTSLPSTAMHKHHKHPLDLTYRDAMDRIYNDICEEDISPKHWFYYCRACNFPAHPKRASVQYPYIRFGNTYTYKLYKRQKNL